MKKITPALVTNMVNTAVKTLDCSGIVNNVNVTWQSNTIVTMQCELFQGTIIDLKTEL